MELRVEREGRGRREGEERLLVGGEIERERRSKREGGKGGGREGVFMHAEGGGGGVFMRAESKVEET